MNKAKLSSGEIVNPTKHFVVSLPKRTNDSVSIKGIDGDIELKVDTKFDEFAHRISHAEVLSVPSTVDTPVRVGDTLFFHHHVILNANQKIEGDLYQVFYAKDNGYEGQAIAYRSKEDGKIHMLSDWLFTQPVDIPEEVQTDSGLFIMRDWESEETKMLKKMAVVYATNPLLDVNIGDTIIFSKNADYEMKLDDGTLVWRMKTDDILAVWERE